MAEPDYGTDIMGDVDIDPTLRDDSGLSLMQRVCVRRLFTPNGSLLSAPSEQTIDLRQFLSEDYLLQSNGTINTNTVRGAAVAALKADARIFQVSIEIGWLPETSLMTIAVNGVGAQGPFQLTLQVSRVTIEVLQR